MNSGSSSATGCSGRAPLSSTLSALRQHQKQHGTRQYALRNRPLAQRRRKDYNRHEDIPPPPPPGLTGEERRRWDETTSDGRSVDRDGLFLYALCTVVCLLFAKELVGDAVPVIVGGLALLTFTPLGNIILSKVGGVPITRPPRSRPARPFVSASARGAPRTPSAPPPPPPPPPGYNQSWPEPSSAQNTTSHRRRASLEQGRVRASTRYTEHDSGTSPRQTYSSDTANGRFSSQRRSAANVSSPPQRRAYRSSSAPTATAPASQRTAQASTPVAAPAVLRLPVVATSAVAAVAAVPAAQPPRGVLRERRGRNGHSDRSHSTPQQPAADSSGDRPIVRRGMGSGDGAGAAAGQEALGESRSETRSESCSDSAPQAPSTAREVPLKAEPPRSYLRSDIAAAVYDAGPAPAGASAAVAEEGAHEQSSVRARGQGVTRVVDVGEADAQTVTEGEGEAQAEATAASQGAAGGSGRRDGGAAAEEDAADDRAAARAQRMSAGTDPGEGTVGADTTRGWAAGPQRRARRRPGGSERVKDWQEGVEGAWNEWGAGEGAAARRQAVVEGWAAGVKGVGGEIAGRVASVQGGEAAMAAVSEAAEAVAAAAQAGVQEGLRDVVSGAAAASAARESSSSVQEPAQAAAGSSGAGGAGAGSSSQGRRGDGGGPAAQAEAARGVPAEEAAAEGQRPPVDDAAAGQGLSGAGAQPAPEVVAEVEVLLPQQYETLQRRKRLERRREVQEQRRQAAARADGAGAAGAWRSMWGAAETAGRWVRGDRPGGGRTYQRSGDARGWGPAGAAGSRAQARGSQQGQRRRRAASGSAEHAAASASPDLDGARRGGPGDVPMRTQRAQWAQRMTARDMAEARARGEGAAAEDFVGLQRERGGGMLGGLLRWVLGRRARQRVQDRVRAARRPVLQRLLKVFPFLRSWGGFM
eukprot:jgi/Ulvmu1/3651/UM017_0065.1